MKWLDILLIIFFIVLAIGIFVSYKYYSSEGAECVNDPVKYTEKVLEKHYKEDYYCISTVTGQIAGYEPGA